MKKERLKTFEDPSGKFKIQVHPNWKYQKKVKNEGPHQFLVSKECVFQISCVRINDHISNVIRSKKLKPHDFSLPNISFRETFEMNGSLFSYIWMCPIEDHFILALYYYNHKTKPWKQIGLDLFSIRMALQNLQFQRTLKLKPKKQRKKSKEKDYYAIESWRNHPIKFLDFAGKKNKSNVKRIAPLNVDAAKLYTLLKLKISTEPNGFYSMMRVGRPLDGMIWWDFVLECDKGFIQVWRTPHIIEAIYEFEEDNFDLIEFFKRNLKKHSREIYDALKEFDKHSLYINHYKSYDECVRVLKQELSKIDLTAPKAPKQHRSNRVEMTNYTNDLERFIDSSVKHHALGKSLVLNAAFKMESFLNLVIRIGSNNKLKHYPEILDKFLRFDFSTRLRNIGCYSNILTQDIDMNNQVIKDALELMTLRNKYVHFDENSPHNRLGEILYDGDFPLHPVKQSRPAVEFCEQVFHNPSNEKIDKAYQTSKYFVEYVKSLFRHEVKNELNLLLEQSPLSYNESRKTYSVVNPPVATDFFTSND